MKVKHYVTEPMVFSVSRFVKLLGVKYGRLSNVRCYSRYGKRVEFLFVINEDQRVELDMSCRELEQKLGLPDDCEIVNIKHENFRIDLAVEKSRWMRSEVARISFEV